jgi:hypothetical protein
MGIRLAHDDEGTHRPSDQVNWNESRYIDFWDRERRIGGWFRIGARPNADYAEMSACLYLPDGRTAFAFDRAEISGNTLSAGGRSGTQTWEIGEPWRSSQVSYTGSMSLFDDPWALTNPKRAFGESPKADVEVSLAVTTEGLEATMGQDQDQHHLIFLPGQADFHYQHLARIVGTATVDGATFQIDGRGGKDHSWGPRNWHAKIFLRWLICCIDDDNGFMLTRSEGPTAQRRSGFVWVNREFRVVDGFDFISHYAAAPNFELLRTEVTVRAGDVEWSAVGVPQGYLPARHRQTRPDGDEAILRLVKHPTDWQLADGRLGTGHLEYHDLIVDGIPVGLHV